MRPDYPVYTLPGKSPRDKVAAYVEMKAVNPAITWEEAAERLGIARDTLKVYLQQARREGWLRFDDPLNRLEFEIIPKTVDNLSLMLDARDPKVTIEVAKGTLFPDYRNSKGIIEGNQNILALKVELPEGMTEAPIITSSRAVGKAKS